MNKPKNRAGQIIFFIMLLSVNFAYATHENDHRFKVYGNVRDQTGKPVEDSKVLIVVSRIDEGTTVFTDGTGYFESVLHMHDDNLGDEIVITAEGVSKKVTADFAPGDTKSERVVEVNFGNEPAAEKQGGINLGGEGGNTVLYIVSAAALLAVVGIMIIRGKKKEDPADKKKKNK